MAIGMLGLFVGTTGSTMDKVVSPIPSDSQYQGADIKLFSLPIAALLGCCSCFAHARRKANADMRQPC